MLGVHVVFSAMRAREPAFGILDRDEDVLSSQDSNSGSSGAAGSEGQHASAAPRAKNAARLLRLVPRRVGHRAM